MTEYKPTMPRPRDAKSNQTLPARAQPGYYPGFSTMEQKPYWDEATRNKIESRLEYKKGLAFFTPDEAQTMQSILDCILPQTDRDAQHRIPLLQAIDQRLTSRQFDGYIYEGCPEDDIAHRLGIHAVQSIALSVYHQSFSSLPITECEMILLSIKDGKPMGDSELWNVLPPAFYWSLLIQDAVTAYYAHPFAWDEIGFGGPAYPRGYMRLTEGKPEPWEKDEARYEWLAPVESRSDSCKANEHLFPQPFLRIKKGK